MDGFDSEQQELIRSLLRKRDELLRMQVRRWMAFSYFLPDRYHRGERRHRAKHICEGIAARAQHAPRDNLALSSAAPSAAPL